MSASRENFGKDESSLEDNNAKSRTPGRVGLSYSNNAGTNANRYSQRHDDSSIPGFGACLKVLDDTIRLYEWLAYHYTTLPLSSVVIGIDKKSSAESVAEITGMARRWEHFGLNITIWKELPKTYEVKKRQRKKEHDNDQMDLIQSCTHHFLDKNREQWLIFTDTDEFLSFNFIQPGEDPRKFDGDEREDISKKQSIAEARQEIFLARQKALPIRNSSLWGYHKKHKTILSLIEAQKEDNADSKYFPNESGCTRIVGLAYGNNSTLQEDGNADHQLLMTKIYQQHQIPTSDFSKCMIDLSKVAKTRRKLKLMDTVHNVYPRICGHLSGFGSGQDFMASVLKVSHYVGSLESWLERGIGSGGATSLRTQSKQTWLYRQKERGPYVVDRPDTTMGDWIEEFVAKVGEQAAQELLFRPLRKQIDRVRRFHGPLE